MQDTAKRDKIEIDVARAARERRKRKKGERPGIRVRRRAPGLGEQGADVTAIGRYRRPRDRFFFSNNGAPVNRKRRRIEYTGGIIGTNAITLRFASMRRTRTKQVYAKKLLQKARKGTSSETALEYRGIFRIDL